MIKSGFFNSVNQDRVYNAEDFSNIFDGIIKDGIFSHLGNTFDATYDSLTLHIATGKAWFNGKYIEVIDSEDIVLNGPEYYSNKIDAVCIKIDENNRTCGFEVIEGSESNTPTKPAVQNEPGIYRYPVYYVKTALNSGIVEIEDNRGTESCPWAENATDKNKALYAYEGEVEAEVDPANLGFLVYGQKGETYLENYTIPLQGDKYAEVDVVFDEPFRAGVTPTIIFSVTSDGYYTDSIKDVYISNITNTGFKIRLTVTGRGYNEENYNVSWLAII